MSKSEDHQILAAFRAALTDWNDRDGRLDKVRLARDVRKLEPSLIRALRGDAKLEEMFFKHQDGVCFFHIDGFYTFLNHKAFYPDSYTSFMQRIGLGDVNQRFVASHGEVVLNFPYKDCMLEGGQTKDDRAQRRERFWNELLAPEEVNRLLDPKVLTNFKRYTSEGEVRVENLEPLKENWLIKGNNLLVLHTLKQRFAGQVKLIYIDPPYNTGNDSFTYNDHFSHSSWLVFMKDRLRVARELLRDDGVIFVQCDDNEQAYLKVLMDEIFGRDNFVNSISLKVSPPNGVKLSHASKTILKEKENIIVFSKSKKRVTFNPQYVEADFWDNHYSLYKEDNGDVVSLKGKMKTLSLTCNLDLKDPTFREWIVKEKENIFQLVSLPRIKGMNEYNVEKVVPIKGMDGYFAYKGRQAQFLFKSIQETNRGYTLARLVCDFWKDISFNNLFQEGEVELKGGKKPEKLLQRIIDMSTKKGDIVLDFFVGSGTTAAVAHKMGRRYIAVEQLDYIENVTLQRLRKVIEGEQGGISKDVGWQGGGRFVYCELMMHNERWHRRIEETRTSAILQEIWKEMREKADLSYRLPEEEYKKVTQALEGDHDVEHLKEMLKDLLDKNMLYVPYSEIDDASYEVSDKDKRLNQTFYSK